MGVDIDEDFRLSGDELDFDDVERIRAAGEALIDQSLGPVRVDCGGLERSSSATVAVLLAWYRYAHRDKKAIEFTNLSRGMSDIIEFSGLSRLLMPGPRD